MGTAEASQAHLGKKEVTTLHAIGQSLALGPIFSAALFIGFISLVAGFSSPVSILLGGLGVLAPDYVIVLYARRFAGAGSIYFAIAGGVIALVWAIALQVSKPDRLRNAAGYATRIEDVAPAAPVDLGL